MGGKHDEAYEGPGGCRNWAMNDNIPLFFKRKNKF